VAPARGRRHRCAKFLQLLSSSTDWTARQPPGAFEAAHSLRDGTFWDSAGKPEDTGETYDLIIVGGGISGLAAAHFYRKVAGEKSRILILDNHDDFGGHAKRNEFRVGNAFRLGFGGTFPLRVRRRTVL